MLRPRVFKRIVGSFSETSSFAYATLGTFTFTFNLWLRHVYHKYSAIASFSCFLALIFATSSTGYVGLGALLPVQYIFCLVDLKRRRGTRNSVIFLGFAPLILAITCLAIYMYPPARESAQQLLDAALLTKSTSQSGLERASWNTQAIRAFWDTLGLGAGIGSVRASSWLIAVPASIGVLGTFFYASFVGLIFVGPGTPTDERLAAIRFAAKMSCFSQLLASFVASGSIDLGVTFFAMSAVACGTPAIMGRTQGGVRWRAGPRQLRKEAVQPALVRDSGSSLIRLARNDSPP